MEVNDSRQFCTPPTSFVGGGGGQGGGGAPHDLDTKRSHHANLTKKTADIIITSQLNPSMWHKTRPESLVGFVVRTTNIPSHRCSHSACSLRQMKRIKLAHISFSILTSPRWNHTSLESSIVPPSRTIKPNQSRATEWSKSYTERV